MSGLRYTMGNAAALLVLLQKAGGEWVTAQQLATDTALSMDMVQLHLEVLDIDGEIAIRRHPTGDNCGQVQAARAGLAREPSGPRDAPDAPAGCSKCPSEPLGRLGGDSEVGVLPPDLVSASAEVTS